MFPRQRYAFIMKHASPPLKKKLNGAFAKRSLQKRACSATAQRLPSVDVQGTGKGHAGEGEKTE